MKKTSCLLAVLILAAIGTETTRAASVVFNVTPGDPAVEYEFSGGGTFLFGGFVFPSIGLSQVGFDAFDSSVSWTITGTGVITNVDTGAVATIQTIGITDGGAGPNLDGVSIGLVGGIFANGGDEYTITGSGTIGVGVGTLDAFNPGSGLFLGGPVSTPNDLTVNVVPEPALPALLLLGGGVAGLRRRR